MEQAEYQAMMMSMPWNGLQLIKMNYEEAYDFAGDYGMNAIIVYLRKGYQMQMVRLYQNKETKTLISGDQVLSKEDFEIYWIGRK